MALPQLVFSFLYVLVAAYSEHVPLWDNILNGLFCLIGVNSVTKERGYDCKTDVQCFAQDVDRCCDSCGGEFSNIFPVHAGYIQLYVSSRFRSLPLRIYVTVNLLYNVAMVAVVKVCTK